MVNEEYMKYVHYIRSWLYNTIYSNQGWRNKILTSLGMYIPNAVDKTFTDNPLSITFKLPLSNDNSPIYMITQGAMVNVLITVLENNIESVRNECRNILANESIRLNPDILKDTILSNVGILFSINTIRLNDSECLITITL